MINQSNWEIFPISEKEQIYIARQQFGTHAQDEASAINQIMDLGRLHPELEAVEARRIQKVVSMSWIFEIVLKRKEDIV